MSKYLMDTLAIVTAFGLVTWAYQDSLGETQPYFFLAGGFVIVGLAFQALWAFVFAEIRERSLRGELVTLFFSVLSALLFVALFLFVLKLGDAFSRLWLLGSIGLAFAFMTGIRIWLWLAPRSYIPRAIAIIGYQEQGQKLVKKLLSSNKDNLAPFMVYEPGSLAPTLNTNGLDVTDNWGVFLEKVDCLSQKLRQEGLGRFEVWIALPATESKRVQEMHRELLNLDVNVKFAPELPRLEISSTWIDFSAGMPLLSLPSKQSMRRSQLIKRAEDILISALLLMVMSPIMFAIALIIKLDSRGPTLFKQRRYGQHGKEFVIWKFRTMSVCEDGLHVVQATAGDLRVTRVGAFLRKWSLDELPQLVNTLKGDMSLVGPRPHAVSHNEFYREKIHGYMERHDMKPGITGWAQVNGFRGETPLLEDMKNRVELDLEYIRNWSLFKDLRILVRTVSTVLNPKNTY